MASRSGRTVFGVNAAVSLALVVAVAAIALVVQPPSPPGIAAFAPQAAKPITKAPPGQSSVSGSGAGQCATGQTCTGRPKPTATRGPAGVVASLPPQAIPPKGVPSALQCYSWPDGSVTQTFDPQSPPCVASWPEQAKGNGGATSKGVTATSIRVAVPKEVAFSTLGSVQPIVDFLNTHFQLYGRKIELVPFASKTSASQRARNNSASADPQAQRADAAAAASLNAFAATDFFDGIQAYGPVLPSYLHTLAANKVIALIGGENSPLVPAAQLASHAPYEWSYHPTVGQLLDNVAALTCQQLVGRPAKHALGYQATKRKFAVLIPSQATTGDPLDGLHDLTQRVAACAGTSPKVITYNMDDDGSTAALSASFSQLKTDGVTSLLYFPWYGAGKQNAPQKVAGNVGYDPEWVTMGWSSWANGALIAGGGAGTRSTFGVSAWNKLGTPNTLMWHQAYTAAAGAAPPSGSNIQGGNALYHELLMLASGAQMAGPNLTPASFAAGLHSTTFANPGAARAPSYQGHVGFEGTDAVMVDDFAGFWLDSSATQADYLADAGFQNAWQMFCYVSLGTRWTRQSWPATDAFYSPRCR